MRKLWFLILPLLFLDCSRVPITGRRQLNLIKSSQLNTMAFDNYRQTLSQSKLSDNAEWTRWVKEVGEEIKTALEHYLAQEGASELVKGYAWEFNLIAEQTVNAWAMPGGKVAFYEGIMPICQNREGVAVVMGHEVAHAIAQHGNERMSQGLMQQAGGVALAVAVADQPVETQNLFMGAYGVGSQLGVMLPFSRKHESEADHLGIIFMAMAGYDPTQAPAFWQRMANLSKGEQPPEFLSTHPGHDTRIENLKGWMPEAMKYYQDYLIKQQQQP